MKPSSGVKPPMPSISRSPFSLELTGICGRLRARVRSASSAGPDRSNGLSGPPPWGFTSFDTGVFTRNLLECGRQTRLTCRPVSIYPFILCMDKGRRGVQFGAPYIFILWKIFRRCRHACAAPLLPIIQHISATMLRDIRSFNYQKNAAACIDTAHH